MGMKTEWDKAIARAMGDAERELHIQTMILLMSAMVRRIGVHRVRMLLIDLAKEMEEFDAEANH